MNANILVHNADNNLPITIGKMLSEAGFKTVIKEHAVIVRPAIFIWCGTRDVRKNVIVIHSTACFEDLEVSLSDPDLFTKTIERINHIIKIVEQERKMREIRHKKENERKSPNRKKRK